MSTLDELSAGYQEWKRFSGATNERIETLAWAKFVAGETIDPSRSAQSWDNEAAPWPGSDGEAEAAGTAVKIKGLAIIQRSANKATVPTVAALRALTAADLVPINSIDLLGYYVAGDGGGGELVVDRSDLTSPDNAGSVFVVNGVRLKAVFGGVVNVRRFGARGDGVTDDVAALTAAAAYAGASSADSTVYLPTGDFVVRSSWRLPSNVTIQGSVNAWVVRGFNNLYQPFATIRNTNFFFTPPPGTPVTSVPANNSNITIRDLKIRSENSTRTGQHLALYGVHDVLVDGLVIKRSFGDWATAFFCRNCRINNVLVMENAALYEDGIHVNGEYIAVTNCTIHSGDDMTAVGYDGGDVFSRYITFSNITGSSEKGYLIKIFAPPEQTAGTTFIEDITYHGMTGTPGRSRNGGFYIGEFGTPRGAIRRVSINGVKALVNTAGAGHDGVQAFGIAIVGCADLDITDTTVRGARQWPLYVSSPKGRMMFANVVVDAPAATADDSVQILGAAGADVVFRNCRITGNVTNAILCQEANLTLDSCEVSCNGTRHIEFKQSVTETRRFRATHTRFLGTCTTPYGSTGTANVLARFDFLWCTTPAGAVFAGGSEFGTEVYIFGNTGLGEQARVINKAGSRITILGDSTNTASRVEIQSGLAEDSVLSLFGANLSVLTNSTRAAKRLVINQDGGDVAFGSGSPAAYIFGGATPAGSERLRVTGGTPSIRIDPITKTQRNALASPQNGQMVYQSDSGNYGPRWYSSTLGGWMRADGTADP